MTRNRKDAANAAIGGIFSTATQNQSTATKLAEVGAERARQRKAPKGDAPAEPEAAETKGALPSIGASKERGRQLAKEFDLKDLPTMTAPWMKIQESVFTIGDPEAEYDELESQLKLTEALTPGNLEQALNCAEDNARRAHKLYVVAVQQFEAFENQMTPIVEALREAANTDLQAEKARGERNKVITDADVKGRASVLFPDEWGRVMDRKNKIQGTLTHIKYLADLWKQRCYSLSSMLSAGKR